MSSPSITLDGRKVGSDHPCLIVAEACDNHLGNTATAKEMIRQAKLAGANAIKFQHHLPDEEMLPDIPMSDNFQEPLYDFLVRHALTIEQHQELKAYCEQVGILYVCTPFSAKAAEELYDIGLRHFKIGSGEMTDHPSLRRIAHLGCPMILSTGMSTLEEIAETYAVMKETGVPFAFMNCVSEYPPLYEDMNLLTIPLLQEQFPDVPIGHSDHTPDLYTSFAAVTLGACIIEKHIILDKRQPGPDQSVSIDMRDLAALVDGVRKIEAALGAEKKVHEQERQIRTWAFRSVVTTRDTPAGTVLTADMLWTKRPGTGIPSKMLPKLLGRTTKRDLAKNTLVAWDDLE